LNARTDDQTVDRHVLGCDLKPTAWCGTEIDTAASMLKEAVFFVELDELEG